VVNMEKEKFLKGLYPETTETIPDNELLCLCDHNHY
jgi:hypothetical protein